MEDRTMSCLLTDCVGQLYTLFVKDQIAQREDGREMSTTNWEYDFRLKARDDHMGLVTMYFDFDDFIPYFRGQKIEKKLTPLQKEEIRRFGVMDKRFVH